MLDDHVSIAKRKLSNFILQPMLQTRIGSYCIILSIIFSAFVALIIYINLGQMFQFIIEMTEAPDEVQAIILSYLVGIQIWIYVGLGAYVALVMAVSIWYTHKLVGPMVAFEKHLDAIEQGNFSFRTHLRKNDAFHEVATVLNRVTETFGKKYGEKK